MTIRDDLIYYLAPSGERVANALLYILGLEAQSNKPLRRDSSFCAQNRSFMPGVKVAHLGLLLTKPDQSALLYLGYDC